MKGTSAFYRVFIYIGLLSFFSCTDAPQRESHYLHTEISSAKALLASRFENLDALNQLVDFDYNQQENDTAYSPKSKVILSYNDGFREIKSVLSYGITQKDLTDAKNASLLEKIQVVTQSPYAIRHREELKGVFKLARRRYAEFKVGDVAFFDIAEAMQRNIDVSPNAFAIAKDSSEKGYVNTFNHVNGQALITALFSENLADFIADVHELHYMPQLTTGHFTQEQLLDTLNYPVDNYIDLINNEIGQELGNQLRQKYQLTPTTYWSPVLLTNVLNDLQNYYMKSFHIWMKPFNQEDKLIHRYASKINVVLAQTR